MRLTGALLHGERLHAPSLGPVIALVYLVIFGSIVAYSAYSFLLKTVTSSVATSYAFVNPLIAVLLGTLSSPSRSGGSRRWRWRRSSSACSWCSAGAGPRRTDSAEFSRPRRKLEILLTFGAQALPSVRSSR